MRDVFVKTVENCCTTFLAPHFGHAMRAWSCFEKVIVALNFFPQSLQTYSYVGMGSLLRPAADAGYRKHCTRSADKVRRRAPEAS